MGRMAGLAAFALQYCMHDALFKFFPGMTLVAHPASLLTQQVTCIAGMGIVAGGAATFFQDRVHMGLGHPKLFLTMTIIANLVALLFQDKLWHNPVLEVTSLTLFFLDHSMYIFHGKILSRKFRVAIKAVLLGKPHLSDGLRRFSGKNKPTPAQKQH